MLLPEDVIRLADLVRMRGLSEESKPEDRSLIARRVVLLHEVIVRGLAALLEEAKGRSGLKRQT